jgi:hypothetical protein
VLLAQQAHKEIPVLKETPETKEIKEILEILEIQEPPVQWAV